ncbi:hypothetical protein [Nostoc sp.]|uniref:hypothetical protein n=1 Tax=Nostoc sp. TaxID=1180 RepID=UPI002FF61D7F
MNLITVKELNDEVAVTCSGGVFYKNGPDPDVIFYRDPNLQGGELRLNASIGDGNPNIGIENGRENGFKDKTSSIRVLRGIWNFFKGAGFKG